MIKLENKNNLIVIDSSSVIKSNRMSMNGIVSISGSMESIEYVASIFKEKVSDVALTLSDFEKWIISMDNQNKLLDIFTSLCLDSKRCSFHCYLSDHTFSKFLFLVRTIFPELNLGESKVQKEIETLYYVFDKKLLLSKHSEINKEFVDNVYSFIQQESLQKKYVRFCEALNKHSLDIEKTVKNLSLLSMADLALFDYTNYSHILLKLLSDFKENRTVWAFNHSYIGLNFYKNATSKFLKPNLDDFELKKIDSTESTVLDIFITNLMVIFHYFWNRFHVVESIDKLNENEQMLIATIWMLFQSVNSGWMITTKDFLKLKQMIDEMRGK